MQESLKEIEKYVPQYGYTKSDTTLSQGEYDGSRYTSGKYTYNDLSSNYSASKQLNDPTYIRKGTLLDPNGNTCGALHQYTGHLYAVKTYKKDQFSEGFEIDKQVEEKWIEASSKCKNLCRCYIIYQQESGLDVVYEHISGESLQKIISNFNNFQEKLIAIFARQIIKGLDYLHNYGLVHGNLKISNVLIDNDAIIKITDLNLFKKTPEVLNYLKSTSSAPETLLKNELTTKSDIWSAGIVLLEMVAGNPWVLKTGELMTKEQVIQTLNKNYAEQEEKSLLVQVSMKDKTIYSQTSQMSRKGARTNSKHLEITTTTSNVPTSYHNELKSFKSQKSDGATSKHKSKFYPSPSMSSIRDLNPDENSHKRLDPHSPMDYLARHKSSLTKTPTNIAKKMPHELARGATTGSKVSYIKMLSVDENQSFVDDKSFSNSQIFNFIQPHPQAAQTAIIIANSIMEDFVEKGENNEQSLDKLKFIEQRMKQIMENSDYLNSEMVSMPPSPGGMQDNPEKTFSFIQVPQGQQNNIFNSQHNSNQIQNNINNMNNMNYIYNNNSSINNNQNNNSSGGNNNNNTNSFSMSQNHNSNLNNNYQIKTQSTLKLKVNDQPVDGDYYSVSVSNSQPFIKINN